MKTLTKIAAVAAAGSLALLAVAGQDSFDLTRRPKTGDVAEYTVNGTFDSGQGSDIKFSQTQKDTVTAVQPSGSYTVEVKSLNTDIEFGGMQIPQADTTTVSEYDSKGKLTKLITDASSELDPKTLRFVHVQSFVSPEKPAKIGDPIEYVIPADQKLGTPAVNCSYKVDGIEKIGSWDTVRLTYHNEEQEGDPKASTKGTLWLNTADGMLVKSDGQWINVQPPGAPAPTSGKILVVRTK